MTNYDTAINRLLGNEGGYVNDPNDPGGETKWGISKRSYPGINIMDLTRDQAIALYRRDFWDRADLENQPLAIGFQMLDFAVNSGAGPALRALQRAGAVLRRAGHRGGVRRARRGLPGQLGILRRS